jgi:hypothetical protein
MTIGDNAKIKVGIKPVSLLNPRLTLRVRKIKTIAIR